VMQYGHKGPEARKSCRLFIGTSGCRSSHIVSALFGNCHQCGDHTALLSEGRTPPSVMPIDSPRESASGGNENSTGDPLVRRLEGLPWGRRRRPKRPLAHDSRILLALACLPFLPTAPTLPQARARAGGLRGFALLVPPSGARAPRGEELDQGSFGCLVNLPLGSRSVDPHSTAVWCGNLLHSSPQSHTAELCCHSSFV